MQFGFGQITTNDDLFISVVNAGNFTADDIDIAPILERADFVFRQYMAGPKMFERFIRGQSKTSSFVRRKLLVAPALALYETIMSFPRQGLCRRYLYQHSYRAGLVAPSA